jgi:hypothetical protein
MKVFTYASAVGSLIYAQVCTRPDLALLPGCLEDIRKILANLTGMELRKL